MDTDGHRSGMPGISSALGSVFICVYLWFPNELYRFRVILRYVASRIAREIPIDAQRGQPLLTCSDLAR